MHGVVVTTLTGDSGIFTQTAKASFITEMQAINEQKDLSKITYFMNQGVYDNNQVNKVESGFLGESLGKNEQTVNEFKKFSDTLKAEIVYIRNNFGKGLMLDTKKVWKDNMFECQDLFSDEEFIGGVAQDFYYISKEASNGKEKKYLYDSVTDICYKIDDTPIGSHIVHSLEYEKWIFDGESMGGIGIVDNKFEKMTSSDGTICYEPNLNNFSYKTEIVYYSEDFNSKKTVPIKEYINNGKQKTIDSGYTFADYSKNKKIWANIKCSANGIDSYWIWIPRYAYKVDPGNKKIDIIFVDKENKPMDINKYGSTLPEGYVLHEAFSQGDGLTGIWFSKYEPTEKESVPIDYSEPNTPDLRNFKAENTKLIYYTEDGSDYKEIDYSSNPEQTIEIDGTTYYFYNYGKRIWANIKCNANGIDSWWVWIPRFAYKIENRQMSVILLDTNDKPVDKATYGDTLSPAYTVHEAFKQGDGLAGIWFSKYEPTANVSE